MYMSHKATAKRIAALIRDTLQYGKYTPFFSRMVTGFAPSLATKPCHHVRTSPAKNTEAKIVAAVPMQNLLQQCGLCYKRAHPRGWTYFARHILISKRS